MMTCTPLTAPEDLKEQYDSLRFFLFPGDSGTQGLRLLVGLHVPSEVHMRLRDILLCQPDYTPENPVTTSPWLEPAFAAPYAPSGPGAPPQQRTSGEVADLIKARYRPAPIGGKKPKEYRWITTCLISDPTEDTTPKYSD